HFPDPTEELPMKHLIPALIAMLSAGIALAAVPGATTQPRLGTDGRPADTRPITEPYTNTGNWMQRHDGFVARAKQGDIDLLLQGDSITDGWGQGGRAVFQKE